jgi:hypothetical protein
MSTCLCLAVRRGTIVPVPMTSRSATTTPTFVCLDCGIAVDQPKGKNGLLRCAQGHRVQVLKTRPRWQIGLLSFWIAFTILGTFIHLLQTVWLTDWSRIIVWLLLVASAAWCIYMVARGTRIMNGVFPIGAIGQQYVVVGIGRMFAVGALGGMAAMGLSY